MARKDIAPVIYKITNKKNLKCYIGQTINVFTNRWYRHFFASDCNDIFHTAIKESKLSDWIFEIIEVVNIPDGIVKLEEKKSFIAEREDYYIRYYNSINHGYNTVKAIAESDVNDERQVNLF